MLMAYQAGPNNYDIRGAIDKGIVVTASLVKLVFAYNFYSPGSSRSPPHHSRSAPSTR